MKIAVIGTGYVGLVSGTCFAETGANVTCIDINKEKIEKLKQGVIPIYEPGLDAMIEHNVKKERLEFSTNLQEAIIDCEAVFIAVGTPSDKDGSADLKYVLDVASDIGQYMSNYLVVINKSTVPIGTAEKVRQTIQHKLDERKVSIPFDVASNPEFLKEGSAIDDFLKPDRIVIGTDSERSEKIMEKLYKPFLLNNHPIIFMDIPSAELTKYAANAMLATKISFINDIANVCEIVGADINSVRKGIGSDPRIGNRFIYAGIGYGGSCFPKDVKALIKSGQENNHPLRILEAVEAVNTDQKSILFSKIHKHFKGNLKGKRICVWGLAFKPHTDDMREAPSITLINQLFKAGAEIIAYDPIAMDEAKKVLGEITEYANDQYMALKNCDALAVVTEWPEFRILNFNIINRLLKGKLIFDGRNIYDKEELKENGFDYYGIGRSYE